MKKEFKKYTKEDSNKKEKTISLRIDQDMYKFLKKNNIDISNYLRDALKKLMQSSLLILLFLASCAQKDLDQVHIQDQEMQSIFEEFKMEAEKRGVAIDTMDLTIRTATDEEMNQIGASQISFGFCKYTEKEHIDLNKYKKYYHKTVFLREKVWSELDLLGKKVLLYHELGHCTLYQTHRGIISGNPNSLMSPSSVPYFDSHKSDYINKNWDSLLNELFYN